MVIGDMIRDEKCKMMVTEKRQKYQYYHEVKLNNLEVNK